MSGGGSNFRTELGTMQAASQHVYDVNAQIQSQALPTKWDASADDLNQVVRQISQSLRTAGDNYLNTERANRQIWS